MKGCYGLLLQYWIRFSAKFLLALELLHEQKLKKYCSSSLRKIKHCFLPSTSECTTSYATNFLTLENTGMKALHAARDHALGLFIFVLGHACTMLYPSHRTEIWRVGVPFSLSCIHREWKISLIFKRQPNCHNFTMSIFVIIQARQHFSSLFQETSYYNEWAQRWIRLMSQGIKHQIEFK